VNIEQDFETLWKDVKSIARPPNNASTRALSRIEDVVADTTLQRDVLFKERDALKVALDESESKRQQLAVDVGEAEDEVERLRIELKQRAAATAERTQIDGAEVERLRAFVQALVDEYEAGDMGFGRFEHFGDIAKEARRTLEEVEK
jgi:hypothetical protein